MTTPPFLEQTYTLCSTVGSLWSIFKSLLWDKGVSWIFIVLKLMQKNRKTGSFLCKSHGPVIKHRGYQRELKSTEQRKVHRNDSVSKFTFEKPPVKPPLPFGLFHDIQEVSMLRDFCTLQARATARSRALGRAVSLFIFQCYAWLILHFIHCLFTSLLLGTVNKREVVTRASLLFRDLLFPAGWRLRKKSQLHCAPKSYWMIQMKRKTHVRRNRGLKGECRGQQTRGHRSQAAAHPENVAPCDNSNIMLYPSVLQVCGRQVLHPWPHRTGTDCLGGVG